MDCGIIFPFSMLLFARLLTNSCKETIISFINPSSQTTYVLDIISLCCGFDPDTHANVVSVVSSKR